MTRRHEIIHTAQTGDIILLANANHDAGLQWEGVGIVVNNSVFYSLGGDVTIASLGNLLDAMKLEHRPVGLFRLLDTLKLDAKVLATNVAKQLFKSPTFWQTVINWSVRLVGRQPIYPWEFGVAGINLAALILKEISATGSTPVDLINSKKIVRLL